MNGATGVPIAQHPRLTIASGAAIGLLAGIALAISANALSDTDISEIGPFSAPAQMCSFNTFENPEPFRVTARTSDVAAMVNKCDYLFEERQYVSVGYRI